MVGWLPKDKSDFVDDQGRPAALWHVVYDEVHRFDTDQAVSNDLYRLDQEREMGEEDLEQHEVQEGVDCLRQHRAQPTIRSWHRELAVPGLCHYLPTGSGLWRRSVTADNC